MCTCTKFKVLISSTVTSIVNTTRARSLEGFRPGGNKNKLPAEKIFWSTLNSVRKFVSQVKAFVARYDHV